MYEMGLHVQPFVIVVGPSDTELNHFYIRVDNIMYESSSFLSSLDTLFKIYITLNVAYPKESENLCYFIQWYLFQIKTDVDIQIPFVYTVINRLTKAVNK